MTDKPKKKSIAVLDANNRLIGKKTVPIDADGIDFGDLPTDGRYKFDPEQKSFVPLGHGFGKVTRAQPFSNELVIARMIEAFQKIAPDAIPNEATEWLEWYNNELRIRDEERAALKGR